ncbi:MAG: hypothetical protein CVU56_20820 [Deltaproteobacteria bacterium HGW-Deltaproteobacteria-14]|nr:MAG: hypothetical protein CVU56_20820 [Deltaproteobacteria bacterium HGW-Deltaproteobacteria-14]
MLVQRALASQPPLPVRHSSTSVQVRPSSARTYPAPQEHAKPPALLVQVWSPPPLSVWHSSTSSQPWPSPPRV